MSKVQAGDRARNGVESGADTADAELTDTELYLEEAAVIHVTPSLVQAPQLPSQIHNFNWHWLFLENKYKNLKMHQKIAFIGPNFFPVSTRKNVNSEMTTDFFFYNFTHLIYKMMQSFLIVKYMAT